MVCFPAIVTWCDSQRGSWLHDYYCGTAIYCNSNYIVIVLANITSLPLQHFCPSLSWSVPLQQIFVPVIRSLSEGRPSDLQQALPKLCSFVSSLNTQSWVAPVKESIQCIKEDSSWPPERLVITPWLFHIKCELIQFLF